MNTKGDLMYAGDWYFDFEKMVAYRGQDYRNFNVRTKDAEIKIDICDGEVVKYFNHEPHRWTWFSDSKHMQRYANDAYKEWFNREFERIVL